jgi:hypothetical protein
MARRSLATRAAAAAGLMTVIAACSTAASPDGGPDPISPQPQPSRGPFQITSPCTASLCGEIPASLQSPRCRGETEASCGWSDDAAVSYRVCEASECPATEPTESVCPEGTTFRGNTCGSENDAPCAWTTACVAPRSTTPCPGGADACGPMPEIGVICSDGSTGNLVCVETSSGCTYQPDCD